MKEKLEDLTEMMKKVYLPLMEGKPDQRIQMEKFVKGVSLSMQQAYGNITIKVPELPDGQSTEQLCNDPKLIQELINTVVSDHFNFAHYKTFKFIQLFLKLKFFHLFDNFKIFVTDFEFVAPEFEF